MISIDIRERAEGQWYAYWRDEMQGPYRSAHDALRRHTFDRLLCDPCYEEATHLLAECQDECNLSLDHEGECDVFARRNQPDQCDHCGAHDRLTLVEAANIDLLGLP